MDVFLRRDRTFYSHSILRNRATFNRPASCAMLSISSSSGVVRHVRCFQSGGWCRRHEHRLRHNATRTSVPRLGEMGTATCHHCKHRRPAFQGRRCWNRLRRLLDAVPLPLRFVAWLERHSQCSDERLSLHLLDCPKFKRSCGAFRHCSIHPVMEISKCRYSLGVRSTFI